MTTESQNRPFLAEARKRLAMIRKDVDIMASFIKPRFDSEARRPPFNIDPADISSEEWALLNEIEELRKIIFQLCMNLMLNQKS